MKEKKENNTQTLIIGLILSLFLIVGQSFLLTQDTDTETRTIDVSGKSEMKIAPDMAEIYISITTENDDSTLAQQQNKQTSAKVIQALKNQGIAEKNIQTESFRLDENYNRYPYIKKPETDLKSLTPKYEAKHRLKIKVYNLDSIGKLVDTAITNGANGIEQIEYTLSDKLEKQVRAQALEKAIQAGKQKANSMATTSNVKLGKVTKILENNYYYTPYNFAANIRAESYDSKSAGGNFVTPNQVEIQSSVNLQFEIQ